MMMAQANRTRRRILAVVSNDFGELANALYFGEQQPLEIVVLVPEHVHRRQHKTLASLQPYRGFDDIEQAIAKFEPDVLCLMSGYLLTTPGLLSNDELARIVNVAAHTRLPLATTDPFLGRLGGQGADLITAAHPQARQLNSHFRIVADLLRDAWHLYLAPSEDLRPSRAVSFYNPHAFANRQSADEPLGLFVLSSEDSRAQAGRLTNAVFIRQLATRLTEAAALLGRAVLIAPETIVAGVTGSVSPDVELRTFCDIHHFQHDLLHATHAWYWNPFSNSVFPRLLKGRPIHFFDDGHMMHAMPTLRNTARDHYYAGCCPKTTSIEHPLVLCQIEADAAAQYEQLTTARNRFVGSAQPYEIIERMMSEVGVHSTERSNTE